MKTDASTHWQKVAKLWSMYRACVSLPAERKALIYQYCKTQERIWALELDQHVFGEQLRNARVDQEELIAVCERVLTTGNEELLRLKPKLLELQSRLG
jgi:hypothetical protein